jgi:ATP-binding protein involved in chromosome partitioning
MNVTKQAVLETLRSIKGPDFEGDIVSLGLVSEIFVADGKVFFSITVPAERAQQLEPLRAAAERAVKAMEGVSGAVVALTAERKGGGAQRSPLGRPASASACSTPIFTGPPCPVCSAFPASRRPWTARS